MAVVVERQEGIRKSSLEDVEFKLVLEGWVDS